MKDLAGIDIHEDNHKRTVAGIVLALSIIFMGGYIRDHSRDFRGSPGLFAQGKYHIELTF